MPAQTIWDRTVDTSWYTSDPRVDSLNISTAEQLAGLARLVSNGVNFRNRTITLSNDIMLNDTSGWQNWSNGYNSPLPFNRWTPIGNSRRVFRGTFDGAGFVISGMFAIDNDYDSDDGFGLFGNVEDGTIKNLGVIASIVLGYKYVGSLVGRSTGDRSIITNCYATGNVFGNELVGGLAGSAYTITNSYATGNVLKEDRWAVRLAGGLAGSANTITNSYATGNVSGKNHVGGLAGVAGTITNSYATGNVSGENSVGGLAGGARTITNSYATGNVSGENYVGGLAGIDFVGFGGGGTIFTITNSYATGNVSGENYVGGLAGTNITWFLETIVTITNSYATGNVSGENYVGGLLGTNLAGLVGIFGATIFTITNSYYNNSTIGAINYTNNIGTPKTTEEMKQRVTYVDWDFTNIWFIDEGNDYPRVRGFANGTFVSKDIINRSGKTAQAPQITVRGKMLNIKEATNSELHIKLIDLKGKTQATFKTSGSGSFPLRTISAGRYIVEIKESGKRVNSSAIVLP